MRWAVEARGIGWREGVGREGARFRERSFGSGLCVSTSMRRTLSAVDSVPVHGGVAARSRTWRGAEVGREAEGAEKADSRRASRRRLRSAGKSFSAAMAGARRGEAVSASSAMAVKRRESAESRSGSGSGGAFGGGGG